MRDGSPMMAATALGDNLLHGADHRGGAGAADFFVVGQRQLQRPRDPARLRLDQSPDGKGVEPLHVAGPAPVEPAVTFGHSPGVGGPGLPVDRHHVGMPRQNDSAFLPGSGMGDQRGLLAVFVPVAKAADAVI
jgi:hypothetical protein